MPVFVLEAWVSLSDIVSDKVQLASFLDEVRAHAAVKANRPSSSLCDNVIRQVDGPWTMVPCVAMPQSSELTPLAQV